MCVVLCVCLRACVCVRASPAEQRIVGSLQGLVLLGIMLQTGVVLQQLLSVGPRALHLQHLGPQLPLQLLPPPGGLLQQGAQLPSLGVGWGGG